jgi:hypothetical protein
MGPFQDVPLAWQGETHVIPAKRVMGAIAVIEETLTVHEILIYMGRGKAPFMKFSMAYGGLLRYLGIPVSDDQVYDRMFASETEQADMLAKLYQLLEIMTKPALQLYGQQDHNPGNFRPAAAKPSKPSKKHSKRRSGKAG